ncbi:hypothetical protein TSUD_252420 [Trifolium subterraneum]|uniref:tRNA-uridine aminocarboxypropyltransferase n=1 Tax=Trifolium subterraneum TaxID=3900 RepID=A0A2Z6NYX0_TRISU|nr:hypothetical protein TSUD_252420 [Trifolium subterraneum]
MSHEKSKRPICPSCSKPTRTCLCSRILTPPIPNSVNVTILQHALESNHPLNSTRIAKMGLNNLTIATVSDVNFQSQFFIHLFDPKLSKCLSSDEIEDAHDLFCDKDSNLIDIDIDSAGLKNHVEDVIFNNSSVETVNQVNDDGLVVVNDEVKKIPIRRNCDDVTIGYAGPAISVTIDKYGSITSLSHIWMQRCESHELGFDNILSCVEAREALSKGFSVKKLQRKKLNGEENVEEYEEFELEICPGSVLLFPSDNAVSISDLNDVGFEVKNLIVLDGTWAKAKRIYSENPWLNILPHLKLEVNEMSLYGEVRNQPKAGYLSTIESVVFALKAVGENHEGLDSLLDTFECMVDDQRRCKDERLSKLLPS